MNELSKRKSVENALRNFKELPLDCQTLFFAILDCPLDKYGINTFYDFITTYNFDYSKCESPIEIMLAMSFDFLSFTNASTLRDYSIEPQCEIETASKKYRADFVFFNYSNGKKLAIECDGHDFHEKTKSQVIKNNERDYDLKMTGYDVIHFSGTEIYTNPLLCALKVFNYVEKGEFV